MLATIEAREPALLDPFLGGGGEALGVIGIASVFMMLPVPGGAPSRSTSTGELRRALVWLMGGAVQTGWKPLLGVLPYMIIGMTGLVLVGHPLNVLQFGEEQAQQLGIRVQRVRWFTILLATLTTAAAVAFVGIIGFVGLVVPHIIRLTWGGDYRRLIPLSMLGGASLLLLTDVVARTVIAPQEIPVGIVTALVGGPFFLWVLHRSKAQNYW